MQGSELVVGRRPPQSRAKIFASRSWRWVACRIALAHKHGFVAMSVPGTLLAVDGDYMFVNTVLGN